MPSCPATTESHVDCSDIGIINPSLIAQAALLFDLLLLDQEACCLGMPCLLRLEPVLVEGSSPTHDGLTAEATRTNNRHTATSGHSCYILQHILVFAVFICPVARM